MPPLQSLAYQKETKFPTCLAKNFVWHNMKFYWEILIADYPNTISVILTSWNPTIPLEPNSLEKPPFSAVFLLQKFNFLCWPHKFLKNVGQRAKKSMRRSQGETQGRNRAASEWGISAQANDPLVYKASKIQFRKVHIKNFSCHNYLTEPSNRYSLIKRSISYVALGGTRDRQCLDNYFQQHYNCSSF